MGFRSLFDAFVPIKTPKHISMFLLTISILNGPVWAGSLGQGIVFPRYSGTVTSVSADGTISFERLNPSTNKREIVEVNQRNITHFDESTIQKILGNRVSCLMIVEYQSITYGECSLAFSMPGRYIPVNLLDHLREVKPSLVGCEERERQAFHSIGQTECVYESEK